MDCHWLVYCFVLLCMNLIGIHDHVDFPSPIIQAQRNVSWVWVSKSLGSVDCADERFPQQGSLTGFGAIILQLPCELEVNPVIQRESGTMLFPD